MTPFEDIGRRLRAVIDGTGLSSSPDEMLALGECTLEHWVRFRDMEPTETKREGFRLLGLHRQGAHKEPSFNACRETCRELVYYYNLAALKPEREKADGHLKMMAMIAHHLFLFVSGRMETRRLGDFCCSSRPLRTQESGS